VGYAAVEDVGGCDDDVQLLGASNAEPEVPAEDPFAVGLDQELAGEVGPCRPPRWF